jgi:hypothetical protein
MALELKQAALVLADISGYTNFIRDHTRSALHAEQIITDLLESIADAAEFPLKISKFEGDAAFMYALAEQDVPTQAVTRDVTQQIAAFFSAFNTKRGQLTDVTVCGCEACSNIVNLKLKAILHFGEVVVKQIRQFEELGGEAAILIHRLLKNSVPAREYVLMTEAYLQAGGAMAEREAERRVEQAEGFGAVPVRVYYWGAGKPDGASVGEQPLPASAPLPGAPGLAARVGRAAKLTLYELSRMAGLRRKPRAGDGG